MVLALFIGYALALLVVSQTRYWENPTTAYIALALAAILAVDLVVLIEVQIRAYKVRADLKGTRTVPSPTA